jgi:hypothetical protein
VFREGNIHHPTILSNILLRPDEVLKAVQGIHRAPIIIHRPAADPPHLIAADLRQEVPIHLGLHQDLHQDHHQDHHQGLHRVLLLVHHRVEDSI